VSEPVAQHRSPARVVGVGGSAGGIDVLTRLVSALPADFPHAMCVVQHIPPTGRSMLGVILGRRTPLEVVTVEGGEELLAGRIYVAPPDRHLLVGDGRVDLTRGPKENGVRPAVDTMLRSLASAYGRAAVAVILSGALGDGANGALAVARGGGTVIVQDPADAVVPSMPERALALVGEPDMVLPADRIAPALAGLARVEVGMRDDVDVDAAEDLIAESRRRPDGPATGFTCPECSGALWELREGELVRYRCRIGHTYSEDAMLLEQGTSVEAALWAALEVLEERAELLRTTAERRAGAHPRVRERLEVGAIDAERRADLLRAALATGGDRPDAFRLAGDAEAARSGT
jgi:two-component system, chemotaxis family, protein-glutamate methylesterase/glutaminase